MSLPALLWLLAVVSLVGGSAVLWHRRRLTIETLRRLGHRVEPDTAAAELGGVIVDGDLHLTEGWGWIFRIAWEAPPSACFGIHTEIGVALENRKGIVCGTRILFFDEKNEAALHALQDPSFSKTLRALTGLGLVRLMVSEAELLVQIRPSRGTASIVVPTLRRLEEALTLLEQPAALRPTASSVGGLTSVAAPALFERR